MVNHKSLNNDATSALFDALIGGSRAALAKSITLIETTNEIKRVQAQYLLNKTLKHLKEKQKLGSTSFRVGTNTVLWLALKVVFKSNFLFITTQESLDHRELANPRCSKRSESI